MTIKDLAEMTLKFGLACQNVSAASQAITTYIRNHLSRCEAQQDHPLLLRHILSGTSTDDELVPAMYSRVGGAPSPNKVSPKDPGAMDRKSAQPVNGTQTERITNFRRGTMVWYLSKAAGVSCPFTRAGIRLCEYGKEGKRLPGTTDHPLALQNKSKRGQAQCGEKRKRLRRGCRQTSEELSQHPNFERNSSSPATDDVDGELSADSSDSDKEEPPPKVKLTLRLRPSVAVVASSPQPTEVIDLSQDPSSSEDEAVSDVDHDVEMQLVSSGASWSLPPYPRRSIAVPCYTPTCDAQPRSFLSRPDIRRSPSVPCSASPPPDSDHDDHDLDIDTESDFDWDSSSMSLASPEITVKHSNVVAEHPEIKQEPQDLRDMLDLWEDLDCASTYPSTVSSATVKLPADEAKIEELEFWEWEFENSWSGGIRLHEDANFPDVKMDRGVLESFSSSFSLDNFAPGSGLPVSPYSPFTPSSPSVPSSVSPSSDAGLGSFSFRFPSPLSSSSLSACSPPASTSTPPAHAVVTDNALAWQDTELLGPDSVHPEEFDEGWSDRGGERRDLRLMRTPSRSPSRRTGSASAEGRTQFLRKEVGVNATVNTDVQPTPSPSHVVTPGVVIVHTCQPCIPNIIATQVEGISVYHTVLDSTPLLRRIDTDFVNLTTLLCHLRLPDPSPLPPACVSVVHRVPAVNGVWAPLSVARAFAKGLPDGIEDVFLSDELVMQFPSALQEFHKRSTPGRMLNQFGPHFRSSSTPNNSSSLTPAPESDDARPDNESVWDVPLDVAPEEPVMVIPPSFDVALAALRPCVPTEDVSNLRDTPLSPSEQELFHTLCVCPDWESEEVEVVDNESSSEAHSREEKPLRRSRRVADARSRAMRLRTRGPRHS